MSSDILEQSSYFIGHLRMLALALRTAVGAGMRRESIETLATPQAVRGGDTIYRLDEHAEAVLLAYCAQWATELPFALVAEGLADGMRCLPDGAQSRDCRFTLIVDPVDGTRELMYGKRSAWALCAVAPPPHPDGTPPTLADIAVALQAELPTTRAALADVLWAIRGRGVQAETHDLRTGTVASFVPQPSSAATLRGGFAAISKFFPGAKVAAAQLEEHLYAALLGPRETADPEVFDDEYLSTGGQLYELLMGHDRFLADLRPLVHDSYEAVARICCHPYDVCTALIAQEAGVIVTDAWGRPLRAPLDTHTPVAWIGYANATLHSTIEPHLQSLLRQHAAG